MEKFMPVKPKPQKTGISRLSLGKISAILGIIATIGTIIGSTIKTYIEVANSRLEIVQSLVKTRTIIIDDLKNRRDQAKHQIEFLEVRVKLDPRNRDLRDETFRQKDILDDLNRLIEKAERDEK